MVFELTADVGGFVRAASKVPGLEFVGADELEADEADRDPALYLMIPDARALQQMVGLWRDYAANRALPRGFAPWRNLFSQMKDLRAWGPEDRLSVVDREILAEQHADAQGFIRIEIELVYRATAAELEAVVRGAVTESGGRVLSSTRIEGARYHALLAAVSLAEVQRILARQYEGLIALEGVMHIRPQSAVHLTAFEAAGVQDAAVGELPAGEPIAAVFDAVPQSQHPRLAGRLSVEDMFALEERAVGPRLHGTAMASAVVNGDLQGPALPSLGRLVHFVSVMYAPPEIDAEEVFPDRLPADLFNEAIVRMKVGADASAPHVIIVNASLGDRNKPYSGRMSGWARVVDYLSHKYGIIFVISAGNHSDDLVTADLDIIAFEAMADADKAKVALRASGAAMAYRRVLAPAESINALTVGALHQDNSPPAVLPASTFDVWNGSGLCTVSSGLGPGHGGAVKPDILAPGGRHHVRLLPSGGGHALRPMGKNAGTFGGILVAAPPSQANPAPGQLAKSIGTSVAAAQVTGLGARVHEALEATYPDFLDIPSDHRAVLLKALLVHSAKWTHARDLIVETLGPSDNKLHVQQKDNIRRYLGFGAIDGEVILECANDRATLWGVGRLLSDQATTYSVPLPETMSGKARAHEIAVTVAWLAPPRVGATRYRGVQIKIVEPAESAVALAVSAASQQPDFNQTHNGTVVHRRWEGEKAAAFGANATFDIIVQRQIDDGLDPAPFAIVVTLKMAGVEEVYTQVLNRVQVKPPVPVAV